MNFVKKPRIDGIQTHDSIFARQFFQYPPGIPSEISPETPSAFQEFHREFQQGLFQKFNHVPFL